MFFIRFYCYSILITCRYLQQLVNAQATRNRELEDALNSYRSGGDPSQLPPASSTSQSQPLQPQPTDSLVNPQDTQEEMMMLHSDLSLSLPSPPSFHGHHHHHHNHHTFVEGSPSVGSGEGTLEDEVGVVVEQEERGRRGRDGRAGGEGGMKREDEGMETEL